MLHELEPNTAESFDPQLNAICNLHGRPKPDVQFFVQWKGPLYSIAQYSLLDLLDCELILIKYSQYYYLAMILQTE